MDVFGNLEFDVKNNTGGDLIITDMKFDYTPFDVVTGPKFNFVEFPTGKLIDAAAFSIGSGDLISTIDAVTPQPILNGTTIKITAKDFKDNLGGSATLTGTEFTVTFYTSTTEYVIGPFIIDF